MRPVRLWNHKTALDQEETELYERPHNKPG